MASLILPEIKKRLPAERTSQFEAAVGEITRLVGGWPTASSCYLGLWRVRLCDDSASAAEIEDLRRRFIFLDAHSLLCAQLLHVGWRAKQLCQGLVAALNEWHLIVAASVARGLIETAAAFAIESSATCRSWESFRSRGEPSDEAIREFRTTIVKDAVQNIMGTRQEGYLTGREHLRRKNIMGFIDKAKKRYDAPELRVLYEQLCDAVHPSFESNACFWTDMGVTPEREQMRILLDQNASGRSEVPERVIDSAIWSLNRLAANLQEQKRCCDDICLTMKLPSIAENIVFVEGMNYFGFLPRPQPDEICPCGSRMLAQVCRHEFGDERCG